MGVKEQIRQFILTNFYVADADGLTDDASLLDRGVVDSTGVMEVIDFLEEKFGIKIQDDELIPENLDSIERIGAFVGRKSQ